MPTSPQHGPPTVGFLAALTPTERAALDRRGTIRRYRTGAALYKEGDAATDVCAILVGRVKVSSMSQNGRELLLALLGPGELLGEISIFDRQRRSATVTAVEPVEALVVSAEAFAAFLDAQPRVTMELLRLISIRFRGVDQKRAEFATHDVLGRLARRLLELMDEAGGPVAGQDIRLPALTQEELASWIGASRETVARAFRELRDKGLVSTDRRRVTIHDVEALRGRAT